MKNFIEIEQLSARSAQQLIDRGLVLKHATDYPSYQYYAVANLFYENSTRTRVSFELAAKHLQMPVINMDINHSSEQKGEVIEDTLKTLSAMGVSIFVIRHPLENIHHQLIDVLPCNAHIINAGDGKRAHPTQSILDMMTIYEKKPDLHQLKIAILGDIKHSRVAGSFMALSQLLGVGELMLIAPEQLHIQHSKFGTKTTDIEAGLEDADVVMCLRVQKERFSQDEKLDLADYQQHYTLNSERLKKAKPDALVLHPGPMNRGIEIDGVVADGAQSLIYEQVKNGVYARMAVLETVLD
tara:strand:- start:1294 stop:2184 length:891 start_codon:yes stop_codon:yes gene_type:complete